MQISLLVIRLINELLQKACRDINKGNAAAEDIKKDTGNENISVMQLDLGSLESVREFATNWKQKDAPIHLLINNAGIMACPYSKTKDGFETQIGVNHLGHFLLTYLLLDYLKKPGNARVICVSSAGHRMGSMRWDDMNWEKAWIYRKWGAYGNSKLANILFARELNKRMTTFGIKAFSLHPGVIMETELMRHQGILTRPAQFLAPSFLNKTIPQGAATTVYLATAPEEEIADKGGLYFSNCNLKASGHSNINDVDAKRLWEISEKMLGLTDA